jgi:hypothetical protein
MFPVALSFANGLTAYTLITGGLFIRSAVTITCPIRVSHNPSNNQFNTHRDCHELLDLLDTVSSSGRANALKLGFDLGHRDKPLLRRFLLRRARPVHDNLLIILVILEQRTLVVDRSRGHLHIERVLLRRLLDLLQVLIVAVLRQPRDDITLRPVDYEFVDVLIVEVVLLCKTRPSVFHPAVQIE